MQILVLLLVGVTLIGLGILVIFLSIRALTVTEVTQRLNQFVNVEPVKTTTFKTTLSYQRTDLVGSFRTRVLQPFIQRVGSFFGRITPTSTLERLDRELMIANNPYGLGAREFFGLRIVVLIVGIWSAVYFIQQRSEMINYILGGLTAYVAILGPTAWLHRKMRQRQDKIRKGLPDALDMLSVTAEAGLGFDQSLQRVSEYWDNPVGVEFGRVVAEMEMGVPRQTALRNMADRLEVPELTSFVAVIIQSDQLGMSIADALHAQAAQMRIERRFRAQEAARKVPLKMLFPMLLLIFPAMLAVICGPSIPILSDFFRAFGGGGLSLP
jgi:tight adherence protein C